MNINDLSDKQLVVRILSGSPDLFGPLVKRHIRATHAIAYARLGNTTDAEDAVQEAFLRAYQKLGALRDPARFAAWLLTIARHEAARIATKRRRPSPLDLAPDSSTLDPSPDQYKDPTCNPDPAQHELNAILRDHVMRLPEPAREVLLLHYFAGHSARDIATLLDLRRPAVLKRLQRAREQVAETMLRDLREMRPTPESFAKQVTCITGLAAAAAIPSLVATPAAVASTAAAGLKVWAGAAAAIVLAAGAAMLVRASAGASAGSSSSPSANKATPSEVSTPSPAIAEAQSTSETAAQRQTQNEPPQPSNPAPAAGARNAPPSVDPFLNQDLNGTWQAQVYESGPPRVLRMAELAISQSGSAVTIKNPPKNVRSNELLLGHGSIYGLRMRLDFFLPELSATGRPRLTLEGDFAAGTNTIQMKGTYFSGEHPYTLDTDEGPQTLVPASTAVDATLTRVPPQELSRREFTLQKEREIQALYAAINTHLKNRAGAYPSRLEELVPAYLASLDPYSLAAGADFEYIRPSRPHPDLSQFPFGLNEIARDDTPYHPELSVPDRLTALEADLARIWGEDFLAPPLVVVTYSKFSLRVSLTRDGSISSVSREAAVDPRAEQANLRAACANNLKQLGLSVQMFMNDMPGAYSPPGWISIYPEFLPDRSILTCPSTEQARMSYKLVWPTANAEELRQLYRDRVDTSASDSVASARVPLVIETHECSGSGGRNVLFLDGHVEYVKGSLEESPELAPFLNLP